MNRGAWLFIVCRVSEVSDTAEHLHTHAHVAGTSGHCQGRVWVRGLVLPAPAFMPTKPSTSRASTSWTQSLGSGLVSFLAKVGSQEQEAP